MPARLSGDHEIFSTANKFRQLRYLSSKYLPAWVNQLHANKIYKSNQIGFETRNHVDIVGFHSQRTTLRTSPLETY